MQQLDQETIDKLALRRAIHTDITNKPNPSPAETRWLREAREKSILILNDDGTLNEW